MNEMMFIPMTALLENGAETPEGNVRVSCKFCNRAFGIKSEDAAKLLMKGYVCEECKSAYEKEQAEANVAAMKADDNTADTIAKAVG